MVRLVNRPQQRRRRLPEKINNNPTTSTAPRVRMCIMWRYILPALILVYLGGLILFVLSLDLDSTSNNNNNNNNHYDDASTNGRGGYHENSLPLGMESSSLHNPPDHVAQIVRGVHKEMRSLERQIWAWTGWENNNNNNNNDDDMFVTGKLQLVTSQEEIKRLRNIEQHLEKKYPGRNVTLCRRPGKDTVLTDADVNAATSRALTTLQYTTHIMASCQEHEPNKKYYYYNPSTIDRYIGDYRLKIPARSIVPVPTSWEHPASLEACRRSDCTNKAHLYSVLPNTTGKGVEPIWIKDNVSGGTPKPFKDCDIPCLHSGSDNILTHRTIDKTPFEFTFSMEGEAYYPHLKIDNQNWRRNKFYATTAFNSEIPLPYFSFAEYDILHKYKPVDFDVGIKGALFLARNCRSVNNRENVVKGLQNSTFRLDSLSSCLKNADPPKNIPIGRGPGDKHQILRAYLFYCSFENQNTPDYITEKLWGAFEAGVVPIYYGAPNVKDHVPEHSLVFVDDFKTVDDLAAHLQKVASNRTLYEEYHAWRSKPEAMAHFLYKYNITRTHNKCRTCRWAYAKKYGLGWSHESQRLLDTQLPRHACRDGGQGLLTWPVRERWYHRQENDEEAHTAIKAKPIRCPPTHSEPWEARTIVAGHWIRTVHEHDGVIDCRIEPKHKKDFSVDDDTLRNSAVLEMVLPFHENDPKLRYRRISPGHYEWQNQTSRITLLVQPAESTPIRRQGKTMIQFMHPQAVRIMVEDVDHFHVGAADEMSYFGKTLKDEWYTPIEVFSVDSLEKE